MMMMMTRTLSAVFCHKGFGKKQGPFWRADFVCHHPPARMKFGVGLTIEMCACNEGCGDCLADCAQSAGRTAGRKLHLGSAGAQEQRACQRQQ